MGSCLALQKHPLHKRFGLSKSRWCLQLSAASHADEAAVRLASSPELTGKALPFHTLSLCNPHCLDTLFYAHISSSSPEVFPPWWTGGQVLTGNIFLPLISLLHFWFTVAGWDLSVLSLQTEKGVFYVLQITECFRREKTQITRKHCWLCFLIRNSHGGDQKIWVSEQDQRSHPLETIFAWMQGTCFSGFSEMPTAQKAEAPSMVSTCD